MVEKGGGEEDIQEAEHHGARTVGLIGQPMRAAQGVVETGGGLKRHARREASAQEAQRIGRLGKGVGRDASGPHLGAAARRGESIDQRTRVLGHRDLDIGLQPAVDLPECLGDGCGV